MPALPRPLARLLAFLAMRFAPLHARTASVTGHCVAKLAALSRRQRWLLALAAPPLLLLAALLLTVLLLLPFTPGISDLRKAKTEQPALVLSADGRELAQLKRSNREWVRLADISPLVVRALVATEDHRFYEHHGIDWWRTGGAALRTFSGDRQGGSTLTQQLARNLYPEDIGRAPTLTRKLKEAVTALKIEALYSKDEILETYLNTVPFLYNAYGIEMAARTYFDTSARRLDVLQSATLVGMLKGNSYYNPVLNPERAQQRRNVVLAQMVKRGELPQAQLAALEQRPLGLDFERQSEPAGPAPHFLQQLRPWLIDWADREGYNLYADGLIIRTTLDSRLQALANQAVARQTALLQTVADSTWRSRGGKGGDRLANLIRETPEYRNAVAGGLTAAQAQKKLRGDSAFITALRRQKLQIQAGFLALDPRNGQVRAWVGSRDYAQDGFDHVAQARRQPGSTFKPFVYGAAFLQGARPDDTLVDQAVEIPLGGSDIWRPSDPQPPTGEPMTLRDGLTYSRNRITAQLMQQVGPARVIRLARSLGVRQSKLEAVPSLALGTSPVSLKEMVSAYAALANGGAYQAPLLVTRIEDRQGRVLAEFTPAEPEQAMPPRTAYTLVEVLRNVVDRGTGVAIRSRYGVRADVAGKTGTTQDNADGWFILMHPELVAGAWVGFNDSRITLGSDYWGQGAHSALPMVGLVVQQALRHRLIDPKARFAEPPEGGFSAAWRNVQQWPQWWAAHAPSWLQGPGQWTWPDWLLRVWQRLTGTTPPPPPPTTPAPAPILPPEAPQLPAEQEPRESGGLSGESDTGLMQQAFQPSANTANPTTPTSTAGPAEGTAGADTSTASPPSAPTLPPSPSPPVSGPGSNTP